MRPWEILGIAPTDDVVAIKRSYAQKLRHARPDDDPHAYQELRDAYDWAINYARWQRERAARGEVDEVVAVEAPPSERITVVVEDSYADAYAELYDDPRANLAAHNVAAEQAAPPPAPDDDYDDMRGNLAAHNVAEERAAPPQPAANDEAEPAHDDGLDATVEQAPPHSAPAAEEPKDWTDPAELARSLYGYWRESGDQALIDAWPRLHHELDRLPLSMRAEASVWFAEFVLQNAELPAVLIARLADYFDWGRDFRSDQQLGSERAHALEQRIFDAGAKPIRDQQVLRHYADFLNLHRLLAAGRRWRARAFAMLAEPRLAGQVDGADDALWRMLQIPADGRTALQATMREALAARAMLCVLLVGLGFALIDGSSVPGVMLGIGACGGILVLGLVSERIVTALFDMAWQWMQGTFPRSLTPQKKPRYLLVATMLAVVGVGIAQVMADPTKSSSEAGEFSAICAVAALLLLWPRTASWRGVVPLLFLVLCIALGSAASTLPSVLAIGLATAWTMLTLWLFDRRHAEIVELYRRPSSMLPNTTLGWVWFALAIQFVLGFIAFAVFLLAPMTLLMQAMRRGTTFAVASLAVVFALWSLFRDARDTPLMLMLLVLVPPALELLQAGMDRLSRAKPLRAAEPAR